MQGQSDEVWKLMFMDLIERLLFLAMSHVFLGWSSKWLWSLVYVCVQNIDCCAAMLFFRFYSESVLALCGWRGSKHQLTHSESVTSYSGVVCIFRLISEMTVEENILKKANQKRLLGDLAIEGGNFTTAYFKEVSLPWRCYIYMHTSARGPYFSLVAKRQ